MASEPPPFEESALVLIDCQREYTDGKLPLTGVNDALAECARVLDAARAAGDPIVHVIHKGQPGGLFDPTGPGGEEVQEVAAASGETIVYKGLPNLFAGTELDEVLKGLGRKNMISIGFMPHMCVSSTVRAGLDLGYGLAVVANACATRDLPDGRGGVVSAGTLHQAELAALSDRFANIVNDVSAWNT
jgi:nicotinamidase-related amidase